MSRLLGLATCAALCVAAGDERASAGTRLVCLGGPITEIVHALGRGGEIVGVDSTSLYPPEIADLPDVGFIRRVSAEGVLALAPTLVLADGSAGPPPALAQLEEAGVRVARIEFDERVPDAGPALARIRRVAGILDAAERGEALVARLERELGALAAELDGLRDQDRPRVLFVYARGRGVLQVAGRDTSAATLIRLAGGRNALADDAPFAGFQPLTAEAIVTAAPDVILALERGVESLGGVDAILELPGVALTPAGRARRVVVMDDLLALSFGPRLGAAARGLASRLHPGRLAPPAAQSLAPPEAPRDGSEARE